jgi:predicted metal-dependent hydrolase
MEYEIIYSKRKSVGIKIKEGAVVVTAPYGLDKKTIDGIVKKHIDWITNALEREKKKRESEPQLSEEDIKALRRSARAYFTEKCAYYALIMGLEYNRVTITGAKTRFGSCSSKKNISFSYRLMLYPEAARDYVVVHELAHLVEMNHSAKFYAIIARYMPDYKARRSILKNGE